MIQHILRPIRFSQYGDELIGVDSHGGLLAKVYPDGNVWRWRRYDIHGQTIRGGWCQTRDEAEQMASRLPDVGHGPEYLRGWQAFQAGSTDRGAGEFYEGFTAAESHYGE